MPTSPSSRTERCSRESRSTASRCARREARSATPASTARRCGVRGAWRGDCSAERPFDVVHLSNPPDFLYLAVRGLRARGARLIFDHHDLAPELYRARFGRGGLGYRVLRAIERRAMRRADVVISSNESYRRLAIERGGVAAEDVFVVRNGPDLDRFLPVEPDPELRRGRRHLLAYVGVMGPQDGIDHALGALAALRRLRDDDWHAIFVGNGESSTRCRPSPPSSGSRRSSSSPAGAATTTSAASSRPPTSASRPTRRARSTTLDDGEGPRVHGHGPGDRLLRPA